MKIVTLKNSFHGTSVNVRVNASTPEEAWFEIQAQACGVSSPTAAAKARLRRVKRLLCGASGCQCGTVR